MSICNAKRILAINQLTDNIVKEMRIGLIRCSLVWLKYLCSHKINITDHTFVKVSFMVSCGV